MIRKSLCAGLLCCNSLPVFAQELTSFTELTQALSEGNEVSVVVKSPLCNINDPNRPQIPKSTMVHRVQTALFTDQLLSFDSEKFTFAKPPYFTENLNQRAVLLLNSEGDMNIRIDFFDAETHKKVPYLKEVNIQCKLGEGAKFYQKW